MEAESLIQPHVRGIEPYEPPDWQSLAALAGIPTNQLIRLDANENAYGPSPRVAEALAGYEDHGLYPDYQPLQAAVARYAGVEPGNIVLGNGGDEIIDLVVRLFVAPGDGVIVCPPAFNMYLVCTHVHRGHDLSVPRGDDFSLDLAGIESLVADGIRGGGHPVPRPALLFVTSPGNPDGQAIPLDAIRRLLQLPLAVVVDEAYIEYGGESSVPLVAAHPNLVVIRTFSKWAGMAGLRLGYAVVAGEVASAMVRVRPPYNVNTAAMIAGLVTLEDLEEVQARIAQTVAERQRLEAALAELPCIEPLTSQASFVFFRFDDRAGRVVADALAEQGILVRSFSNASLANAMRVTVGRPEQNEAFLMALQAVIKGEGAMRRKQGSMSKVQGTMEEAEGAELRVSAGDALAGQPGMRRGRIERRTGETEVSVTLDLDGTGRYEADTGLGFLDHMLAQLAAHGLFDLVVQAQGDLEVDEHHTIEDVAIGLGQALDEALGVRRGIVRMGQAYAPLDEALAHVVVDLSGRPYAIIDVEFATPSIGAVGTDLIIHFLETLAFQARISLHARVLYGRNDHHKAEALFKALGRALDAATRLDPRRQGIPSTKGML